MTDYWFFFSWTCLTLSERTGDLMLATALTTMRMRGVMRRNVMPNEVIKPGVRN